MNVKTYALICLLTMASTANWAQLPPPGGPGSSAPQRHNAPDLMAENFFPPELIMQNQKALNLTAEQQTAIRTEMQQAMAKFTDLQWQQSAESEALETMLKQERVDEKLALAQLDKLLAIESNVKRLHFSTVVRVKNILTTEQQSQLRELKKQRQPAAPARDRAAGNPSEGGQGERQRPAPPQE